MGTLYPDIARRLGEFDILDAAAPYLPRPVTSVLFGLLLVGLTILARAVVDQFAATAGPYSLIYPAILLSTLYGRWSSGLVTFVGAFLYAWYFVLPHAGSFGFAVDGDAARTAVNGFAGLVILLFAEIFRSAVRRLVTERDAEIAQRDMLMRELEHRTKNNFAVVISLLELQAHGAADPAVRDELRRAAGRVHSFAAVHQSLHAAELLVDRVGILPYLEQLAAQLGQGLFGDRATPIRVEGGALTLPRDQAVSVGLFVNEAVTNAAKHAFTGSQDPRIAVRITGTGPNDFTVSVADNGLGLPLEARRAPDATGGLGRQLIEAFAQRAGGRIDWRRLDPGTEVCLFVREGAV
jgi:two-component sensor histidine kinase